MKYRRKPIEVTAMRFEKGRYQVVRAWCGGTIVRGVSNKVAFMDVPVLDGFLTVRPGDWVVRGPDGLKKVGHEVFERDYEPVEES